MKPRKQEVGPSEFHNTLSNLKLLLTCKAIFMFYNNVYISVFADIIN